MARLTKKFQLTLPKATAEAAGMQPGDDLECDSAGDIVRVRVRKLSTSGRSTIDRLTLFDLATERQEHRNRDRSPSREADRGWSREELYDR